MDQDATLSQDLLSFLAQPWVDRWVGGHEEVAVERGQGGCGQGRRPWMARLGHRWSGCVHLRATGRLRMQHAWTPVLWYQELLWWCLSPS